MTTIPPCLVCLSVMWLNYGAIMWCSFRVRRTLKRRMSLSLEGRTTNSVNRQISTVMLFQVSGIMADLSAFEQHLVIEKGRSIRSRSESHQIKKYLSF